jgi:hypothetical protein
MLKYNQRRPKKQKGNTVRKQGIPERKREETGGTGGTGETGETGEAREASEAREANMSCRTARRKFFCKRKIKLRNSRRKRN